MKLKLAFTIFLLLIPLLIFAETQKKEPTFEYLSGTKNNAEIKFYLGDYSQNLVNTSNGDAVIINTIEGSKFQIKDAPDLPKISKSIIIPDYASMEIKIKEKKYIEIENILIAPSKGVITRDKNPDDIPFVFGKTYQKNEFFPREIAELGEPYILRDFRGQVINIMPFQYNPVSKVLRIYTEITFEVVENADIKSGINVFNRTKSLNKINGEFNEIYKNHFLNYSNDSKYTSLEEAGNMLIISHSDYISALDTFVNWKNQRGLKTELVEYSSIGSSANDIKTYVENYYNTNDLVYLLLVGDAEQIPSLEKSGDSDAAYGHITGEDSYAEVFVGRFSAETIADVETQVKRSIYYERDIQTDAIWLSKGIGIASDEGTSGEGDDGESDVQHMNNIRTDLLNYGYDLIDQIYDPGASSSTVAESVNNGRSAINYVGHGSDYSWGTTGFSITNVNALTNENMLPFIFDVACVNGNFHGQTCFAESWLRATNNNNPTGAVAIIASTINQSWASPMDAQDEMIDILVESYESNIKRTFGGIAINGCMHMIDEYGTDGANMTNTWTIFGDPSLLVRTKAPEVMSITHNSIIYVGSTDFEVSGNDDCLVSLMFNNELISTCVINGGSANPEFEALPSEGILTVTITGYNKVTYIAEVNVEAPSTPYVIHKSNSINDIAGNNNQQADYGESLEWNVELKNISDLYDAFNIETKLRCADTNVVLIDTLENYGNLPASQDSSINSAYSFNLKNKIKDQQGIKFELYANGQDDELNAYEWISRINLNVNAPNLKINDLFVDDKDLNNNGILDPGETVDLMLIVENRGHANINNLTGLVSYISGSTYFTIIENETDPFSLEAGQIDTLSFKVSVDEQEQIDTPVQLEFNLVDNTYNFYSVKKNTELIIGEVPAFLISEEGSHIITTSKALFYDSGGESEDYSNLENYTITFSPESLSKMLKAEFLSFSVEPDSYSCFDYLEIYDGENISSTLIGSFCNANPPTEIIATNNLGALTFKFYSDNYVTEGGWKAELTTAPTFEVEFNVTDNNGAIEKATIIFNGDTSLTDSNGDVSFDKVIKNIEYSYSVSKPGYEFVDSSITFNENLTAMINLEFIGYNVGFNVSGNSGNIEGVRVEFNSEEKHTDNKGSVIFEKVMPDVDLSYILTHNLYDEYNGEILISGNDTIIDVEMSKATGINDVFEDQIKIYPNPSTGIFNLEINNAENSAYTVKVFDIIGTLVYTKTITGISNIREQIDISQNAKGMYFLSVESDNSFVMSKRIIIK